MHDIERARQMREEGISSSVCLICWLAKAVFILIQKLIVLGWKDSHSGSLISSFRQWQPWVPGPALGQAPVAGWTIGEQGQGLEIERQIRAGLRLHLPDWGPQGSHKYASRWKHQRQIQTWWGFHGLLTVCDCRGRCRGHQWSSHQASAAIGQGTNERTHTDMDHSHSWSSDGADPHFCGS